MQLSFQLFESYQKLLFDDRLVDIDWYFLRNMNRYFNSDRYFYNAFTLNWLFNVDRLIDIDWLLDNCGHFNRDCLHYFFFNFFHYFKWHFLLHLDVFRHFHYFLYDSLRPRHKLRYLHQYFHWLFHDDLFHDFFGCAL